MMKELVAALRESHNITVSVDFSFGRSEYTVDSSEMSINNNVLLINCMENSLKIDLSNISVEEEEDGHLFFISDDQSSVIIALSV